MKPLFRRGQTWDSPHHRARTRAGERLWEVLDAGESEWLDRHLAECRDCRAVADSYEAQRLELRGLRDRQPVPPRDLWARTAAAIEREDARRRPSLRPDRAARTPILRRKRPSPVPLGAISGLLVVAVVVGVSLLGGRQPSVAIPTSPLVAQTQPPRSLSPGSTPIAVTAGPVGWLRYGPEGQIDVFFSPIDEVCADTTGPACAPIEETPRTGDLPDVPPQTVVMSPKEQQLVVVQAPGGSGTGKVMVVPVPTAPGSSPDPTPTPVITETPTPPVVETPTPPVVETPTPPVVETPTPPVVETPTPPVTETPTPVVETPTPTPVGPQEIASDVIVVGQSAGYSSDGVWFAFSAKPTDGSHGPDIYLWRVGDPQATPITSDHVSVFSGWLADGRLLASRPALAPIDPLASPSPVVDARPESYLIDPETGAQTILDAAPFWRPSVAPSNQSAIYWDGVLTSAENGFEWRAGTGQLVLGVWPPVPAPVAEPQASEAPASEEPASEEPAASPGAPALAPLQVIDARAIRDWDARWNETGSHVAIWIADEADPTIGFLSLYVVDPETGTLDLDNPLMASQALPGFSIGSGRIAWATPPGQDGNGSHVEVVAWTKDASGDDASGKVESAPGEEQVVVIR